MTNLSFLHLLSLLITHGALLFLFISSFSAAQPATSSPPTDQLPTNPTFNPSLAILMIIIVSAFFLIGFFSVYISQCADRRYGGVGSNPASISALVGGGRWSRRGQQGLDAAVIETFPTFLYSMVKGHKIGKDSLECAVCLNEFEDDQTLRLIPKCSHVFHPDCIDAWLASHTTCPVCRANLVPKPGDSAFDSARFFETNNYVVEPDHQSNNVNNEIQRDVLIHNSDNNNNNNVPEAEPPLSILLNKANQKRPRRSRSTGWQLGRLFTRSHSTGHSLVQPGENFERFTLRLPEEVRNQLMSSHLNRTKSSTAFPRAMSSRTGYRSKSVGNWRSKNYFNYERFEREGRTDRFGFARAVPFFARTGSVRSVRGAVGGGSSSDEVNVTLPKNLFPSDKSPFHRLFAGVESSSSNANNSKDDVGGRSSDVLRVAV